MDQGLLKEESKIQPHVSHHQNRNLSKDRQLGANRYEKKMKQMKNKISKRTSERFQTEGVNT